MTKSRLFPGDLLISIPRPLLITVETVLSSEIGEQVKCKNVKFTRQQLLSLSFSFKKKTREATLSGIPTFLFSLRLLKHLEISHQGR